MTITGRVTAADQAPLVGADVSLSPGAMETATDSEGRYAFQVDGSGVTPRQFTLEVRHIGYESEALAIVVGSSGVSVVDVFLRPLPAPAPEPFRGIVLDSFSGDEVMCIAPGAVLDYTVTIANEGSATAPSVILHDTLDAGFGRGLAIDDIVVDRTRFSGAEVTLDPGGRSFSVELGPVSPTSAAVVYTVALPAGPQGPGVYCNRVTAADAGARLLATAASCVTNTLAIEIDLINEAGAIVGGSFTPGPEIFNVGDGGSGRPQALVFRVAVANENCFPIEDLRLSNVVGARMGAVEFRSVEAGYPTRGTVSSTAREGFAWEIGTLAVGEVAEIRFRAEAVRAGEDINRAVLTVSRPNVELVNEEPVTILP